MMLFQHLVRCATVLALGSIGLAQAQDIKVGGLFDLFFGGTTPGAAILGGVSASGGALEVASASESGGAVSQEAIEAAKYHSWISEVVRHARQDQKFNKDYVDNMISQAGRKPEIGISNIELNALQATDGDPARAVAHGAVLKAMKSSPTRLSDDDVAKIMLEHHIPNSLDEAVASPQTGVDNADLPAHEAPTLTKAEIFRRIESREKPARVALSYLYDTSTLRDTFNVAAMSWRTLGSDEVRNLYDQLYMSAEQYQGRAIRSLSRAKSALAAGDAAAATWFVRTADFNLKQMRATYSASMDLYAGELQAAERTARTVELAGSVAAFGVGVGAAPAVVATLNGVDFVGGVLAAGIEGGRWQATKEAIARALTAGIIKFVPLSVLDGKTIEEASKQTARQAMTDLRLQAALRRSLVDSALRKKIAAWVFKSIKLASSELARVELEAAISNALDKMAQGTQPL